jgi:hypothetical protein
MVEDRITGGRRIAQLLASELDGRSDGPLGAVAVVDADPEVDPAPEGAHAYGVTVRGEHAASVFVHPDSVRLVVATNAETAARVADDRGLGTNRGSGADGVGIIVEDGAAVKRAVDAVTAAIEGGE